MVANKTLQNIFLLSFLFLADCQDTPCRKLDGNYKTIPHSFPRARPTADRRRGNLKKFDSEVWRFFECLLDRAKKVSSTSANKAPRTVSLSFSFFMCVYVCVCISMLKVILSF